MPLEKVAGLPLPALFLLAMSAHLNLLPDSLRQLFIGKNTLEVARILADVFVSRFGECWGNREDILKALLPKGRASTWSELDKQINVFGKKLYGKHNEPAEENSPEIGLLDEVRFILQDLPQRQDYKLPEGKEEYPPEEAGFHFVLCSLCWRSVVRRPLEKRTPLCHTHDLPSSSPAYRRRARMKPQVEVARLRIEKIPFGRTDS